MQRCRNRAYELRRLLGEGAIHWFDGDIKMENRHGESQSCAPWALGSYSKELAGWAAVCSGEWCRVVLVDDCTQSPMLPLRSSMLRLGLRPKPGECAQSGALGRRNSQFVFHFILSMVSHSEASTRLLVLLVGWSEA